MLILHANVVSNLINPMFYFIPPETRKSHSCLIISAGIKMKYWLIMS